MIAAALALAACAGEGGEAGSTGEKPGGPGGEGLPPGAMIVDGIFSTPESVLHDGAADTYLVSNVDGAPLEADGSGFISRVSPEGEVTEARWIDGQAEGVELNAPKGMAILGDTLYVADIDCVRRFVRTSGAPAGSICFPGATFVNDVAVDDNGVLYATDTGMQAGAGGLEASGSDAVWRFRPDGRQAKLLEGESLGRPNGIAFGPRGGFVVTFGSGEIYQIGPDGSRTPILPASDRQLDGIAFTSDGGFLFSSWGNSAVYRVTTDGQVEPVLENVDAPADIGYDADRNRVLVPLFNDDQVVILGLDDQSGGAGA